MTDWSEQPHARARGRLGEDDAVRWLAAHGFEIVERNVVNHGGEIDVVAKEGPTLCFIEIKARDGKLYGPAIAAVTPGKQRRLSRAASLYIAIRGLHRLPARFDVLGLDREGDGWRYTLVRNAFPYNPGPVRRRW
ncbi:MAG TPA: YraN family protein [Thermoanaerobaculia bacterium]|nr:YraN family protein [Thermoanaerobaculia bacterium]